MENVGRLAAYLFTTPAGHVFKVVLCNPLAFQKLLVSLQKTSRCKFLDVKLARFIVRIAASMESNRSVAAGLGKRVLYFTNAFTQLCRYIEPQNVFFWLSAKKPPNSVVALRICGRFQFFTANLQVFAVRNRFANPQIKTLSSQFAELRTCGPICGSAQHCFAATSCTDLITLKDNGRGNGATYPTHKKRYLVLHEPPLIKSCTDIIQFVEQLLHLNYPNHAQSVERAVKLATTASARIDGAKKAE